jgi:non-ribosomal peptide synthetase component F
VIHKHTLGRANRDYADRTACVSGAVRWTFGELHQRVGKIAAALRAHGLARGDRLALLLPNGVEYIELTYACAWLGVTAVPLNTRLSVVEIDRILVDAEPRGLIRHSSLPTPAVAVPWQVVLDHDSLLGDADGPEPIDDPDATLALVYTSGTTGHPKGVVVTHANMLANVDHVLYWMPREERWVYLHVAPMFHILDLPFMFASPALGSCQVTIPKFSPRAFCEAVERERVTRTTMVPTMIAVLTEFPAVGQYDLTSLRAIAPDWTVCTPRIGSASRPNARWRRMQAIQIRSRGVVVFRKEKHNENVQEDHGNRKRSHEDERCKASHCRCGSRARHPRDGSLRPAPKLRPPVVGPPGEQVFRLRVRAVIADRTKGVVA